MNDKTTIRQRKKTTTVSFPESISATNTKSKVDFLSIIKSTFFFILCLVAVVAVVTTYGWLKSPYKVYAFNEKDYIKILDKTGVLSENDRLTKGKKIVLASPESIVEDNYGNLFTGLKTGNIVKIAPSAEGVIGEGHITNLTSGVLNLNDTNCISPFGNRGRPLGMRLLGNTLYVADAFYGLYTVDVNTEEIEMLIAPNDVSPPMAFPDDLTITKDGKRIYFTDCSSEHTLAEVVVILMRGLCDGRVFQYDIPTKTLKVVLSGLCFANGIQLTEDDSKIILAETTRSRIRIIDTKTWKTIKIVNLPAFVDNVRANSKGTYWVACSVIVNRVYEFMDRNTWVRQALVGLFSPSQLFRTIQIESNALFEITEDGDILQSLYDIKGELTTGLTQATELSDGRLALGSHTADFMSFLNAEESKAIGTK